MSKYIKRSALMNNMHHFKSILLILSICTFAITLAACGTDDSQTTRESSSDIKADVEVEAKAKAKTKAKSITESEKDNAKKETVQEKELTLEELDEKYSKVVAEAVKKQEEKEAAQLEEEDEYIESIELYASELTIEYLTDSLLSDGLEY